jgi:hypothetical protein
MDTGIMRENMKRLLFRSIQHVLLKENETKPKVKSPKNFTHIFKVKAPLLKNEVVCLSGNSSAGQKDTGSPLLLPVKMAGGRRVNLLKKVSLITSMDCIT